ncbi:MAG: hypothetical protein P8J27_09010 [Mariniblastus sp.]|nr:hypothetical protein [Mariniblastus sp.]
MKSIQHLIPLIALGVLVISGCSNSTPVAEKFDASPYLLNAEPENGVDVAAVREAAKDQEDITIVGRIGGNAEPWVKDRAAFYMVDRALLACSDEKEDGEDCSCPTPWDYCCETDKLPNAMVLVKFVDSDGAIIKHDAKDNFGIKELDTVVIQGKAERDDAGNMTVLAKAMFVRK